MTPDEAVDVLDAIAPTKRAGQRKALKGMVGTLHYGWHSEIIAPTGTGKSFDALIAAAAAEGTVVLSTGTLGLMKQYRDGDVPAVVAALRRLGIELDVVMLKGRANYACKAAADARQRGDDGDSSEPHEVAVEINRTARWAMRDDHDGDLSRAPWPVTPATREALTVDSDSCLRKRCDYYDDCHFERVKQRAAMAKVVLTNHAVLCAHAASGGHVLPPFDHVIVDEAHKLEEFAIGAFSVLLSFGETKGGGESGNVARLGHELVKLDPIEGETIAQDLRALATRMRLNIEAIIGDRDGELTIPPMDDPVHGWRVADLDVCIDVNLRSLLDDADRLLDRCRPSNDARSSEWVLWQKASSRYEALHAFRAMLEVTTAGTTVYLTREKRGVAIKVTDTAVGKYLRPMLWDGEEGPRGVVLMSATLPLGCGERLGLVRPQRAAVPSPFNLPANLVVYVADDLPPATYRHRAQWEPHATARACEIADRALTSGGVLVLCSSFAQAKVFGRALEPVAARHPGVRLIVDRKDVSKEDTMDQLHAVDRPLFVGSRGFYEGLDRPRTWRAVIIPTIPFAVPNDPVQQARQALQPHTGWPHPLDAAMAMCHLEQMMGRLIRCADDRGVVAVLDRRMLYGEAAPWLQSVIPAGVRLVDHRHGSWVLQWMLHGERVAA